MLYYINAIMACRLSYNISFLSFLLLFLKEMFRYEISKRIRGRFIFSSVVDMLYSTVQHIAVYCKQHIVILYLIGMFLRIYGKGID